ncbi:hypothetical protein PTKIN_Ptkin01aG0284600 [Pterospermum kingtungense]
MWHYHGGCQVGKVVARDYKVLGVDGLRIIDGSTFSFSPGTNPQATLMMLGSDTILFLLISDADIWDEGFCKVEEDDPILHEKKLMEERKRCQRNK